MLPFMPIEVLDDIIEELADKLGIYGRHDSPPCRYAECRACFVSELKDRITRAAEIERKLAYHEIETRLDREREMRRLEPTEQG